MGSWTILPESWSGARLVNARDPLRGLGLNACAAVLGDVRWDRGSGPYGGGRAGVMRSVAGRARGAGLSAPPAAPDRGAGSVEATSREEPGMGASTTSRPAPPRLGR